MDKVGWYDGNSGSETPPVGQLKANGYGNFNFYSNICESCADDVNNPGQYRSGAGRCIICGGNFRRIPDDCRDSYQFNYSLDDNDDDLGCICRGLSTDCLSTLGSALSQ